VPSSGAGHRFGRGSAESTLEVILETLKSGGKVGPPGFGTLEVRETKARNGVRPGTSERIEIPTGKKLAFKIASDLKADL